MSGKKDKDSELSKNIDAIKDTVSKISNDVSDIRKDKLAPPTLEEAVSKMSVDVADIRKRTHKFSLDELEDAVAQLEGEVVVIQRAYAARYAQAAKRPRFERRPPLYRPPPVDKPPQTERRPRIERPRLTERRPRTERQPQDEKRPQTDKPPQTYKPPQVETAPEAGKPPQVEEAPEAGKPPEAQKPPQADGRAEGTSTPPALWEIIPTPGDGFLCGFYALMRSLGAQMPDLPTPTLQELLGIYKGPAMTKRNAAVALTNRNYFGVDQVAGTLYEWGLEKGANLQLGCLIEGRDPLLLGTETSDNDNVRVLWIHNNNVNERNPTLINHFSGLRLR